MTRAAKGALAAGVEIASIEIDKAGTIVVVIVAGTRDAPPPGNEWDDVR